MWFLYLLTLIVTSVGAGAFMSYDAELEARSAILEQKPTTRAELSSDIIRSLRRIHQIDPTLFPQPEGQQQLEIPQQIISAAVVGGRNIPMDVTFLINGSDQILAEPILQDGFNSARYTAEVARSGASGHSPEMTIRDRNLNLIDRSAQYDFSQTINYENIEVGEDPVRTGGGIKNEEP